MAGRPAQPLRPFTRGELRHLDPDALSVEELRRALRRALTTDDVKPARRLAETVKLRARGDAEEEALLVGVEVLARKRVCRRPTAEQIERLRRIWSRAPTDPTVVASLVRALLLAGDTRGARETLDAAPVPAAGAPEIRGAETLVLAAEGRLAQAREMLRLLREGGQAGFGQLTSEMLLAADAGDWAEVVAAYRARCALEGRRARAWAVTAWRGARWVLRDGGAIWGWGFWFRIPWTWIVTSLMFAPAIALHRSMTRCACCTLATLGLLGLVVGFGLLQHLTLAAEGVRWMGALIAVESLLAMLRRVVRRGRGPRAGWPGPLIRGELA